MRLIGTLRDRKAGLYFRRHISVAIQRGNADNGTGTFPNIDDVGLIDYLPRFYFNIIFFYINYKLIRDFAKLYHNPFCTIFFFLYII